MAGELILLVDDDEDTLRSTSKVLTRLGCAVKTASTAREAVELIRVEYEDLPAVFDIESGLVEGLNKAIDQVASSNAIAATDQGVWNRDLVIAGPAGQRFVADPQTGEYGWHEENLPFQIKVETHNHPTAISPFPGAATGSGGEIRDEGATGGLGDRRGARRARAGRGSPAASGRAARRAATLGSAPDSGSKRHSGSTLRTASSWEELRPVRTFGS